MTAPSIPEVQPVGVDAVVARLDRLEERHARLLAQRALAVREVNEVDEALAVVEAEHRELVSKLRSLTPGEA